MRKRTQKGIEVLIKLALYNYVMADTRTVIIRFTKHVTGWLPTNLVTPRSDAAMKIQEAV